MKRAAFFLGSGISYASHAPTISQITDAVLKGGWCDDGKLRFSPTVHGSNLTASLAQNFLRILKRYIDPHLQDREQRASHYEDLYAAADEIFRDEILEMVNPVIRGSLAEIKTSMANLLAGLDAGAYPTAFARLVESGLLLITWGVFHLLRSVTSPHGIEILSVAAQNTQQMDVFTLNHDLLIERQFALAGIPFSDGFSEEIGDVRRFNWSWRSGTPVCVFKLHGSIDWYRFRFSDVGAQFAKVPIGTPPDSCVDADGENLELLNAVPFILAGTIGKERLYGFGFPGAIFREVHDRLATHHTLICSGYGWADKGINNRINQWLQDSLDKRIVILHGDPIDTIELKHFWSKGHRWNQLKDAGKIVVVPKWLRDCTLGDLEVFFEN